MTEQWRPVPGSPEYVVSDLGNVARLLSDGSRRPLKATQNRKRDGSLNYLKVCLGRARQEYVHNLVAYAFLGPRPDGHDVDHISHDRLDCSLANLRYRPVSENRGDWWAGIKHDAWDADARGERWVA